MGASSNISRRGASLRRTPTDAHERRTRPRPRRAVAERLFPRRRACGEVALSLNLGDIVVPRAIVAGLPGSLLLRLISELSTVRGWTAPLRGRRKYRRFQREPTASRPIVRETMLADPFSETLLRFPREASRSDETYLLGRDRRLSIRQAARGRQVPAAAYQRRSDAVDRGRVRGVARGPRLETGAHCQDSSCPTASS